MVYYTATKVKFNNRYKCEPRHSTILLFLKLEDRVFMCGYAHIHTERKESCLGEAEETRSHIAQASHKLPLYYLTFPPPPPEHRLQKGSSCLTLVCFDM